MLYIFLTQGAINLATGAKVAGSSLLPFVQRSGAVTRIGLKYYTRSVEGGRAVYTPIANLPAAQFTDVVEGIVKLYLKQMVGGTNVAMDLSFLHMTPITSAIRAYLGLSSRLEQAVTKAISAWFTETVEKVGLVGTFNAFTESTLRTMFKSIEHAVMALHYLSWAEMAFWTLLSPGGFLGLIQAKYYDLVDPEAVNLYSWEGLNTIYS